MPCVDWQRARRTRPSRWNRLSRRGSSVVDKMAPEMKKALESPELRAAYNAALPRVTEFWTRLGADERLYAKYKAMDVNALSPEQRQAHKNAMRNFHMLPCCIHAILHGLICLAGHKPNS